MAVCAELSLASWGRFRPEVQRCGEPAIRGEWLSSGVHVVAPTTRHSRAAPKRTPGRARRLPGQTSECPSGRSRKASGGVRSTLIVPTPHARRRATPAPRDPGPGPSQSSLLRGRSAMRKLPSAIGCPPRSSGAEAVSRDGDKPTHSRGREHFSVAELDVPQRSPPAAAIQPSPCCPGSAVVPGFPLSILERGHLFSGAVPGPRRTAWLANPVGPSAPTSTAAESTLARSSCSSSRRRWCKRSARRPCRLGERPSVPLQFPDRLAWPCQTSAPGVSGGRADTSGAGPVHPDSHCGPRLARQGPDPDHRARCPSRDRRSPSSKSAEIVRVFSAVSIVPSGGLAACGDRSSRAIPEKRGSGAPSTRPSFCT